MFCEQQDGYFMQIKSLWLSPQLLSSGSAVSNDSKPVFCFCFSVFYNRLWNCPVSTILTPTSERTPNHRKNTFLIRTSRCAHSIAWAAQSFGHCAARQHSSVAILVFLFSVSLVFSLQNNHFPHSSWNQVCAPNQPSLNTWSLWCWVLC